jgi:peptide chain release factor 2
VARRLRNSTYPSSSSGWRDCERASASSGGVFDVAGLRAQLEELEIEMARPDLWDDPEVAQGVGRKKNAVERELGLHDRVEGALDDAGVLLELAEEEKDPELLAEVVQKCEEVDSTLESAGRRCCFACICAGPSAAISRRRSWISRRPRRPASEA